MEMPEKLPIAIELHAGGSGDGYGGWSKFDVSLLAIKGVVALRKEGNEDGLYNCESRLS